MTKRGGEKIATLQLNVAGNDPIVVLDVLEKLTGKLLIIYPRKNRAERKVEDVLKKVMPNSLVFEKEGIISICKISKIEQIELMAKTKFRTY